MKRYLFILISLIVFSSAIRAKEMYVVLSPENDTLSFYYDNYRNSRSGIKYSLNTGTTLPKWSNEATVPKVKTINIDSSFADARPNSTYCWFSEMANLTTINGMENLNTSNVTTMQSMFYSCSSLTSLDVSHFDTSKVTSMRNMFNSCSSLISLDLSGFDTSNVTTMYAMFSECNNLTSLDVSNFNISKVTNMYAMFNECTNLKTLDLSNFDTSKATNTSFMFDNCHSLESIIVSATMGNLNAKAFNKVGSEEVPCLVNSPEGFDFGVDTSGDSFQWKGGWFKAPSKRKYLLLTQDETILTFCFDDKYAMRDGFVCFILDDYGYQEEEGEANGAHSFDNDFQKSNKCNYCDNEDPFSVIDNWGYFEYDRSGVKRVVFDPSFAEVHPTSCCYLFYDFKELEEIEGLEFLNTSEVTNMACMFQFCKNLKSIDLSHFDTSKISNKENHYDRYHSDFPEIELYEDISGIQSMFEGCRSLKSLDLSNFDTSNMESMTALFKDCSNLTSINFDGGFNTSAVNYMDDMFAGCSSLVSLNLENFNTSNVVCMNSMFKGCSSLVSLNLENFNTSNVVDMNSMFKGCSRLESLDLGDIDTSNVCWMEYMFNDCSSLKCLDLSNFDTSGAISMLSMFEGCSSLTSLDLSHFDTSNVYGWDGKTGERLPSGMEAMFKNCNSLTSLDVSHFNVDGVFTFSEMFSGCSSLENINLFSKYYDDYYYDEDYDEWFPYVSAIFFDYHEMFKGCHSLTSLDLSGINTPIYYSDEFANTKGMLEGCKSVRKLALSSPMEDFALDACEGVGTDTLPCDISTPDSFDFGDVDTSGIFQWKGGWFRLAEPCMLTAKANMLCAGSTTPLIIGLDNGDKQVTGFEFFIRLPEGVSLSKEGGSYTHTQTERCGEMTVKVSQPLDNLYHVVASTMGLGTVSGNSGPVAILELQADDDLEEGEYEGRMENIVITTLSLGSIQTGLMPFTINVSNHPLGDVNHDGNVNVVDVMMTVDYVLTRNVPYFYIENSDVNGDGSTDISDVMGIVNIVLYTIPSNAPALATSDKLTATPTTSGVSLCLDNATRYTAMEATVTLPRGTVLAKVSLDNTSTGHRVVTSDLGGGQHRVVVLSLTGEPLLEGDALLHLDIKGDGNVAVGDVVLASTLHEALTTSDTTGVLSVSVKDNINCPTYHINGTKAKDFTRGVIIQNGRKPIVH